ncbi:MAG: methyl-accepting chemotaxis protein [Bacillota bacterium]
MFARMKLGTKIITALCAVTFISLTIGFIGYKDISDITKDTREIAHNCLPGLQYLQAINEAKTAVKAAERTMLIPGIGEERFKHELEQRDKAFIRAEEAWKNYGMLPKAQKQEELWNSFVPAWETWKTDSQKYADFMKKYYESNDDTIYAEAKNQCLVTESQSFKAAEALLGEVINENLKESAETVKSTEETGSTAKRILIGAIIAGVLLALVLGILFLRSVSGVINGLMAESKKLVESAVIGRLDIRGDMEGTNFEFRGIVQGMNEVLDKLVGHIDAVPTPVMIIDKDFSIQYLNQTGLDLLGLTRQQVIATKCYNHFKTSDCNTANCACGQALQQGQKVSRETDAHPRGMNLDIAYTGVPIKDAGGKTIGVVEIVVDQTAVKTAGRKAQKQAAYQEKEVEKLIVNLGKLAKGDLRVETEVAETDEDTRAVGENFHKINTSLGDTVQAVNLMAVDANMLAQEAVEGKLNTRVDASRHGGEYRNIVEGINRTLDAVVHPISEAAECLKEMARGNMNVAMTGDYKGDHAIIKNALNSTIDSINEILGQVEVAVDQVANGSRQISDSSQALSQGASESASTLEEITSSMEQVTAQTKNTADNATHANQLADQARQSAEKGNGRMMSMVEAMNEINESAADISKIIKAIDEIAFQTNLLALNAAVEAARAGKHGKGFAVVAEEVRNLAERSARAAKETAELIEGSIKKTEAGTRIVEETSKALEEIVAGATKVTDLIGEIASASKEQALGIGQINQGLGQVDQVVQQNTASAEELAASSEELSAQALQLKQMLGRFQLKAQRALQAQGVVRKAAGQARGKGMREAAAAADAICLDDQEFGDF